MKINGKIGIGLRSDESFARWQDDETKRLLTQEYKYHNHQKNSQSKNFVKNFTKPDGFQAPQLTEAHQKSGNTLVIDYLNYFINKLFPQHVNEDDFAQFKDFTYSRESYLSGVCFQPYNDDSKLQISLTPIEHDEVLAVMIELNGEFDYLSHFIYDAYSLEYFARQFFYALTESPYFTAGFYIDHQSYIDVEENDQQLHLQYHNYHFVEDLSKLKEQAEQLTLVADDEIGYLIPFDEFDDGFLNCDGFGYFAVEKDGKFYKSTLTVDADYEIDDFYKEYFTHILWYNK